MSGISLQFLDGIAEMPAKKRQKRVTHARKGGVSHTRMKVSRLTPKQAQFYNFATQNYTPKVANEIDTVLKGLDFYNLDGTGTIEDEEKLRNYLQRTKNVIETTPQVVAGYYKPDQLAGMIGYVLNRWDSAERENALDKMADIEEKMIENGLIKSDELLGEWHYIDELQGFEFDEYEYLNGFARRKAKKNGFFNHVKRANTNSALSPEARNLVANNPILKRRKELMRNAVSRSRKAFKKQIFQKDENNNSTIAKTIDVTTADTEAVNGLCGFADDSDLDYNYTAQGVDLLGCLSYTSTEQQDLNGLRAFLLTNRDIIENSPQEYFTGHSAQANIAAIDHILDNWHNETNRNRAISDVASRHFFYVIMGLGNVLEIDTPVSELAGLLGKATKAAKAQKKADKKAVKVQQKAQKQQAKVQKKEEKKAVKVEKKAQKAVVKAQKKEERKVKKAERKAKRKARWQKFKQKFKKFIKKVWRVILKINPLTLMARGGLLLAVRLNMFKLASRLYLGSISETEYLKLGYPAADYQKYKNGWEKAANIHYKIGGDPKKLASAAKKGAKKIWKGADSPTNKADLKTAATAEVNENPELAREAEMELNNDQSQAKKDGTVLDENYPENMVDAVDKSEDVETVEEREVTVAVDVETGEPLKDDNGNYITEENASEVETAVNGLATIGLIENGYFDENDNLGAIPVVIAAITAAIGVITAIIKALASAGVGGDKMKKAATAMDVVSSAAQGANSIYQATQIEKLQKQMAANNQQKPQSEDGENCEEDCAETDYTQKPTQNFAQKATDFLTNAQQKVTQFAQNPLVQSTIETIKNKVSPQQEQPYIENNVPPAPTQQTAGNNTMMYVVGGVAVLGILGLLLSKGSKKD